MARTQGHGNPKWNRDETLLALDLYLLLDGRIPSENDSRVKELSHTLRSMPYHREASKVASFRNPAGVAFKLQNLHQVATGKGLANVSRMDREIWAEFGYDGQQVRTLAASIRSAIKDYVAADNEEEEEFREGRLLTRLHYQRERNPSVRQKLLKAREPARLACDLCDADYRCLPEAIRTAAFEAHHLIPLSECGERKTKISELALLCASCHRILHRAIAAEGRWLTIAEARSLLKIAC